MGAIVKTLDEIQRDFEGRDEPEQIKRAIHEYVRHEGIEYVMLVGNAELMPIRYQYTGYTSDGDVFYSGSEEYCTDRQDPCGRHPKPAGGTGQSPR